MKPLYLIAAGPFGEAVLDEVKRLIPGADGVRVDDPADFVPAGLPYAPMYAVAAWRPAVSLCKLVESTVLDWKRPWVPLVLEHPTLRLGPVVAPGKGGCFHCALGRQLQHSGHAALTKQIWEAYDANRELGPKGFLPAAAGLGAALLAQAVDDVQRGAEEVFGSIRQFHLLTRELLRTQVTPIHGCPRCGSGRDERSRSVADLVDLFAKVLATGSKEGGTADA